MTVKEFYELCRDQDAEEFDLVHTNWGLGNEIGGVIVEERDIEINENGKEVVL